jgi:hypothetical protein
MPDFNPFDMGFSGDVDGTDLLGFDYLMQRVLQRNEGERDDDEQNAFRTQHEWYDDDQTEDY